MRRGVCILVVLAVLAVVAAPTARAATRCLVAQRNVPNACKSGQVCTQRDSLGIIEACFDMWLKEGCGSMRRADAGTYTNDDGHMAHRVALAFLTEEGRDTCAAAVGERIKCCPVHMDVAESTWAFRSTRFVFVSTSLLSLVALVASAVWIYRPAEGSA